MGKPIEKNDNSELKSGWHGADNIIKIYLIQKHSNNTLWYAVVAQYGTGKFNDTKKEKENILIHKANCVVA